MNSMTKLILLKNIALLKKKIFLYYRLLIEKLQKFDFYS